MGGREHWASLLGSTRDQLRLVAQAAATCRHWCWEQPLSQCCPWASTPAFRGGGTKLHHHSPAGWGASVLLLPALPLTPEPIPPLLPAWGAEWRKRGGSQSRPRAPHYTRPPRAFQSVPAQRLTATVFSTSGPAAERESRGRTYQLLGQGGQTLLQPTFLLSTGPPAPPEPHDWPAPPPTLAAGRAQETRVRPQAPGTVARAPRKTGTPTTRHQSRSTLTTGQAHRAFHATAVWAGTTPKASSFTGVAQSTQVESWGEMAEQSFGQVQVAHPDRTRALRGVQPPRALGRPGQHSQAQGAAK